MFASFFVVFFYVNSHNCFIKLLRNQQQQTNKNKEKIGVITRQVTQTGSGQLHNRQHNKEWEVKKTKTNRDCCIYWVTNERMRCRCAGACGNYVPKENTEDIYWTGGEWQSVNKRPDGRHEQKWVRVWFLKWQMFTGRCLRLNKLHWFRCLFSSQHH